MKIIKVFGLSIALLLGMVVGVKGVDATYILLNVPDTITVGDYKTTVAVKATVYPLKAASQEVTYKVEPEGAAVISNEGNCNINW